MVKRRLDTLLAERGLFPSRTRAAASVMAGEVLVGRGERRASKPGEMIDSAELLTVREGPAFVSRGGIKLANALGASGLDVRGRRALDIGVSTGGFTDCLLQRGALRGDRRRRGLRDPRLPPAQRPPGEGDGAHQRAIADPGAAAGRQRSVPERPLDLAVIDVSFISLGKVLGAAIACLEGDFDVLALVKPQFEVGRERVGKGGVVRDPADRRAALIGVGQTAIELGTVVLGYHSSGLPGPKGNLETFIRLAAAGRAAGVDDPGALEALAREVEP